MAKKALLKQPGVAIVFFLLMCCVTGFQIDLSILSLCTEHTLKISGVREREHREGGQADELQEAATPGCHHGTPEENGCHHGSTATAG